MALLPTIPNYITVHLGTPDSAAENITVSFPDYIKNVASSEIYPTWPENAIRANIYAQISYAMNRIYLEYYRSRGYSFDITNSTAYDQSFVNNRDIYENISNIVDAIFNSYVVREGGIEPYFTQYCDGIEVTCTGLSQWGTVDLAEQGMTPLEILKYYYGDDIYIQTNVEIAGIEESSPTQTLTLASVGDNVRQVQLRLNRIRRNYPAIPEIVNPDGYYGVDTEEAVRAFQQIFNLPLTGDTDKSTWYRILFIFNSVKRLADLNSEGLSLTEISDLYPDQLELGSSGYGVRVVQYYLRYIGLFDDRVQPILIDGVFGPLTETATKEFQSAYEIPVTGIVDELTYTTLYDTYLSFISSIPVEYSDGVSVPFPGRILRQGLSGNDVKLLQEYLNYISNTYTEIPKLDADGFFGENTIAAVNAYQRLFGLTVVPQVGNIFWDSMIRTYERLFAEANSG